MTRQKGKRVATTATTTAAKTKQPYNNNNNNRLTLRRERIRGTVDWGVTVQKALAPLEQWVALGIDLVGVAGRSALWIA